MSNISLNFEGNFLPIFYLFHDNLAHVSKTFVSYLLFNFFCKEYRFLLTRDSCFSAVVSRGKSLLKDSVHFSRKNTKNSKKKNKSRSPSEEIIYKIIYKVPGIL